MKLTEQEARQIYSTLSSEYKADARQAYAATLLKLPNTGRPKDMLKTTPKDLIATCILMLHSGVILEHVTLRHAAMVGSLHSTPEPTLSRVMTTGRRLDKPH
jgi:hypothetical protein